MAGQIDAFEQICQPLVVFMYGMGEDMPIGVLPGEVGSNVPAIACSLFTPQEFAQDFFVAAGAGDPHRLDADGDGVACEIGE
jgi:hypothetical protein